MTDARTGSTDRTVWRVLCACLAFGLAVFVVVRVLAKAPSSVVEQTVPAPIVAPASKTPVASTTRTEAPTVPVESVQPTLAIPSVDFGDAQALVRGSVTSRATDIANAKVRFVVERDGAEEFVGETSTDAKGRFTFSGEALARACESDAYLRVEATANGYQPGLARYGLATISATHGLRAEVRLAPGCLLEGRVVDARRAPVENAAVTLLVARATGSATEFIRVSSVTTHFDGRFSLGFDSGGTYRITARAEGIGTAVIEKLELEANVGRTLDDLVLKGGAPILGRVVTASGDPVPFLDLWAIDTNYANEPDALAKATLRTAADERDDGLALAKTTTDSVGRFQVEGLRPGHYALRSPDRAVVIEPHQARYEPGTKNVELVVSSQRLVVRVVRKQESDRGSVAPSGARNRSSSEVPARTAVVHVADLSTEADGSYKASNMRYLNVNGRTGIATVALDAESPISVQAFNGEWVSSEEIVILARNEWTRELTLTLADRSGKGSVRFDVLGEDGLPLTHVVVEARSSTTNIPRDDIGARESDEHGILSAVPAGSYQFTIGFAPGTDRDHFFLRTKDPVVVRGGEETVVSLRARRGSRMRVSLDMRGAKPAGYDAQSNSGSEDLRARFGTRVSLTPVAGGAATSIQFRAATGPGVQSAILPGETLVSDTLVERGEYDITVDSRAFKLAGPLRIVAVPGQQTDATVAVTAR